MKSKTIKLEPPTLKEVSTKRLIELANSFRKPNCDGHICFYTHDMDAGTSTHFAATKEEIWEELDSRDLKYGDICDYLNLSAIQLK